MSAQIIRGELSRCLLLNGDPIPKNFEDIIQAFVEELKEIPTNELSDCFRKCRQEQKFGKLPKIAHIFEVWRGEQKGKFNSQWDRTVRNMMEERLKNPAFFARYPDMLQDAREYLGRNN